MALIACPECEKQISETTPACPHCGYLLSVQADPAPAVAPAGVYTAPTPTKIGEVTTDYGIGITFVAFGSICMLGSFVLLIVFFLLGMFALVGSIMILTVGIQKISGGQDAYCPHCGKLGRIGKTSVEFKCPICKKRSVRDGEYLKPII